MSLPPPGPPSDGQPAPGPAGPTGGFGAPSGGGFGPPTGGGFGPPGHQPGAGPPIVPPGAFQPPPQTPIPVTSSGDKPPSHKGKFIIAALVIAALAGGGIAFAATRGGDDDGNSDDRDDRDDRDEITLPDDLTIPDEITLPDEITIPDFSLPDFTFPENVTIPDEITLPDNVTIPDEITLPDNVTIPDDVTLPSFPSDVSIPEGPPTALGTAADLGNGFSVQVNSFNPDDTAALTGSPGTPEPADGNVYATVNVTISYDGQPGFGYVVALDFTALRPPDVRANWYSSLLVTAPDALPLAEQLQPGDDVTGTIVFEVPSESTGELTLVAASLLSFDESAVAFALH